MNYLIVEDGVIVNIIVCDNDEIAAKFGAVASYEGANIGAEYSPPAPETSVWDELDAAYQEGVNSVE